MQVTTEQLSNQFKDLKNQFDDVVMNIEPNRQIEEWAYKFDELNDQVGKLRVYVDRALEKHVEFVSPEELKQLWSQSGVSLKDIERDFNVSTPTASRMANGQTKDIFERSKMKNYFLRRLRD